MLNNNEVLEYLNFKYLNMLCFNDLENLKRKKDGYMIFFHV